MRNLFAHTAIGSFYPGYVSINRTLEGDVSVTVRSAPTVRQGAYICAVRQDAGKPGRCYPGDERCNNYCNMAPTKGPMQDHPLPCEQVSEGQSATFIVPAADWPWPIEEEQP